LSEKHVFANDIIVKEGDSVDSVYFIVSGIADVKQSIDKDHPDEFKSIATLSSNEAIGLNESGFYSISGVRTATVVALTDMVLLRLSVAAFHGFALAYSHVTEVMRQHAKNLLNNVS
jgi:CRP-like cAMP-binding protein